MALRVEHLWERLIFPTGPGFPLVVYPISVADLGTLGCQEMLGLLSPAGQASNGKKKLLAALETSMDGGR